MKRKSIFSTLAVLAFMLQACSSSASDWPYWRGPEQTGATRENAVVTTWSSDGENLLWNSELGGRCTPIIMNGRVFGFGLAGHISTAAERVFCLDANTGRTLWEHRFNVFHTDIVENRVGWASPVGDPQTGNVYVHGTGGEMFCFNRDGKILWKHSMAEEYGRVSGYGGRLHNPIIDEDRVIVSFLSSSWGNQGRPLHRYVAFNKHDGRVMWWSAPGGKPLDTTYAAPVVAVIDGVRQLIAPNADGNVYGMKARTGQGLWKFRFSKRGLNVSPVVNGDHVFVAQSEECIDNTDMGRVVCIDASKRGDITETGEVWRIREMTVGYASPAIANGRLYLVDNSANLFCIDAATGTKIWEFSLGRVGKGSPVVTADGVIYVGEQTGTFHILRDAGDKCVSLDRHEFKRADNLVDEIYGSPAVSNGRVVFMTRYGTYCLGSKGAKVELTPIPPMPAESTASADGAGFLQIVPAEVTLSPGETVRFELTRFDQLGRRVGTVVLPLTPIGLDGRVSADGSFTAPNRAQYTAGYIVARAEGLEAKARVRICPKLPISDDFESYKVGSVPSGWIGVGGKTKIVERDGGKMLRKLAPKEKPSPPIMRLRAYAGPPIPSGYTVQADMMSELKKKRRRSYLPEQGLINARYRFIMMRSEADPSQTILRIESWSPVPRFRHDVPFDWTPDTWYTAKFEVTPQWKTAVCRVKVWPRGESEPDAWNMEVTDALPNVEGSPGLYCYSTGTTSGSDGPATFFDNFKVTRK